MDECNGLGVYGDNVGIYENYLSVMRLVTIAMYLWTF